MNETSFSLLTRLKDSQDAQSWNRLLELYGPLLHQWLRGYDVQPSDADDLVQEVLMTVAAELPRFEHNGQPGAFRSWLRTTLVYRLRNFWRARDRRARPKGGSQLDERLAALEDPASQLTQLWNRQHDRHVLNQLLAQVENDFAETTWKAFRETAIKGKRADEAAKKLGISVNAAFIAKSRVLSRLRQAAEGLIESSSDFSNDR